MKRIAANFLSILLTASILASVLLPSLVLTSFHLNRAQIIEQFCVNKDKPAMKCNGQCHLMSQLKKSEETSNPGKEPLPPVKEMNFHYWLKSEAGILAFILQERIILTPDSKPAVLTGFGRNSLPPPKSTPVYIA